MGTKATPMAPKDHDRERVTVYFSIEEGWIHILYFDWTADMDLSFHPCKSSVVPYSASQMRFWRDRAERDRNVYIFQSKRDNP